jgi:hypothetical protein
MVVPHPHRGRPELTLVVYFIDLVDVHPQIAGSRETELPPIIVVPYLDGGYTITTIDATQVRRTRLTGIGFETCDCMLFSIKLDFNNSTPFLYRSEIDSVGISCERRASHGEKGKEERQ